MSKSSTTTEAELLDEIHPGDLVRIEFMEPLALNPNDLAAAIGVAQATLRTFLDGKASVSADLDLRLGRYLGVSEGFFLGLQIDYDLRMWRRSHASELERIVPLAA